MTLAIHWPLISLALSLIIQAVIDIGLRILHNGLLVNIVTHVDGIGQLTLRHYYHHIHLLLSYIIHVWHTLTHKNSEYYIIGH